MNGATKIIAFVLLCIVATNGISGVPACGAFAASPYATKAEASPRECPRPTRRGYTPRYRGIGYSVLDSESAACFVPDDEYRLLDQLIDEAKHEITIQPPLTSDLARNVGRAIGAILSRNGFAFYTPLDTLSDALYTRRRQDGTILRVFDCDTNSIIYLTIAENLSLPASMVEMIFMHGDSDHNFVRWRLEDGNYLDWDTNERSECRLPPSQPAHVGRSLTRKEVQGYMLSLRAELWKRRQNFGRALDDFRHAVELYPESALSHNNLAWLIATTQVPHREQLVVVALRQTSRAVELVRKPNNLDTQACVYALAGNFEGAKSTERDVVRVESNDAFAKHLRLFEEGRDCTGQK